MNLIRRAQAAVSTALNRVCGDAVTYKRGDEFSVQLTATQGRTKWTVRDSSGMLVVTESVDWLFPFADLEETPAKFDRVEFVPSVGVLVVYQVMPFGPEGRLWRWHGTDRSTVRVYTKLLSDSGVTP